MPRRTDPDLVAAIGARVAQLRKDRGLTQAQLAELTGLEPLSVSRCEVGARAFSLSNLALVADALGVSLGDLVDAERPAPKPRSSPSEAEWARIWTTLSEADQARALAMMRAFLNGGKKPSGR